MVGFDIPNKITLSAWFLNCKLFLFFFSLCWLALNIHIFACIAFLSLPKISHATSHRKNSIPFVNCSNSVLMWNEHFIREINFPMWMFHFKYEIHVSTFYIWNFEPVYFTGELGILYVKTFRSHMWKENFICQKVPIPYVSTCEMASEIFIKDITIFVAFVCRQNSSPFPAYQRNSPITSWCFCQPIIASYLFWK